MNFYPAYKYDDVLEMPVAEFNHHLEVMKKVAAYNRIEAMQVSAYPHLKPEEAKKIHKQAYKEAETEDQREVNVITLGDIQKVLNGR